jgi:hypothetical protein
MTTLTTTATVTTIHNMIVLIQYSNNRNRSNEVVTVTIEVPSTEQQQHLQQRRCQLLFVRNTENNDSKQTQTHIIQHTTALYSTLSKQGK